MEALEGARKECTPSEKSDVLTWAMLQIHEYAVNYTELHRIFCFNTQKHFFFLKITHHIHCCVHYSVCDEFIFKLGKIVVFGMTLHFTMNNKNGVALNVKHSAAFYNILFDLHNSAKGDFNIHF